MIKDSVKWAICGAGVVTAVLNMAGCQDGHRFEVGSSLSEGPQYMFPLLPDSDLAFEALDQNRPTLLYAVFRKEMTEENTLRSIEMRHFAVYENYRIAMSTLSGWGEADLRAAIYTHDADYPRPLQAERQENHAHFGCHDNRLKRSSQHILM